MAQTSQNGTKSRVKTGTRKIIQREYISGP